MNTSDHVSRRSFESPVRFPPGETIHRSAPYLAGLEEERQFSQVPLYVFVTRGRQLEGAGDPAKPLERRR